ncbi:hypothetical protein HGM15179_019386 [Zosterops borbonicus]|uniref:Reverse transcriptase/retrotransposon-derived protein RNase H-like domain-containing protein n=1 Tax=Zosterops borbonicus TaxID=364589 RepID=A0A8K1FY69_9PASS|nr:hypothetical protein HGM15179_019386 [Zosterops borbonicus]
MMVIGVKGDPFKVPVIKNVEIESETRICLGNMLLVEEADYSLLGSNLMIAFGVNLIVQESQLVDEEGFKELKETLIAAPVLSLPNVKRQFQLFVDVNNHTAHGVLTQDWAGTKKPVGYVSKLLDPVSRGWSTCLQGIVAVALLVEEAKKVTFGAPLVVYTPHNVRSILQQKADKWLTDARLLKYEAILIHSHDLELWTTAAQNPAQFLFGEALEEPTHNCAEVVELQTKIRLDLEEEELEEGEKWFVDGSARVIEGKRKTGYAIVDDTAIRTVEKGWMHVSRVKKIERQEETPEWKVTSSPGDLKIKLH